MNRTCSIQTTDRQWGEEHVTETADWLKEVPHKSEEKYQWVKNPHFLRVFQIPNVMQKKYNESKSKLYTGGRC